MIREGRGPHLSVKTDITGVFVAMRRRIQMVPLSFMLIALILVSAISAGAAYLLIRRNAQAPVSVRKEVVMPASPEDGLTFQATLIFDGVTEEGWPFSNQTYQSSDCDTLSHIVTFLPSPESIEIALERELKQATRVLQRGPKFNSSGELVGERAVISILKEQREVLSVIWSQHSELHSISSSSLEHVLKLENWLMLQSRTEPRVQPSPAQITFEITTTVRGSTKKGISFVERQFKSTECVTITDRVEYHASALDVQKKFQTRVGEAVEILERGKKFYESQSSDRLVAVFPPDISRDNKHQFEVIWTNDAEFHSIRTSSLRHLLAFEKQLGH